MGPDADRHAKLLIHPAVEGLAGVGVLVNGRFALDDDRLAEIFAHAPCYDPGQHVRRAPAAAATTSVRDRFGKFCAAAACADKRTAAIAAITDLIIVFLVIPDGISPPYR
jgi:hypothetical protein